jgi:hypothetical protein
VKLDEIAASGKHVNAAAPEAAIGIAAVEVRPGFTKL